MESKRKVVYHGDEHSHKKGKNIWGVSVTVKNNTAKRIVIASDGLLGKVERPDVISVNVPGALIGDLIQETKNIMHPNFCALVILSGGNYNITPKGYGFDSLLLSGNEKHIKKRITKNFTREVVEFSSFLKEHGGKLILTSPLPLPKEVDDTKNVSNNSEVLRKFISSLFVALDDAIHSLNDSEGIYTPNIKSKVEVKTGRYRDSRFKRLNSMLYKGTNQRKINLDRFNADLVSIKNNVREAMVEYIFNTNLAIIQQFK